MIPRASGAFRDRGEPARHVDDLSSFMDSVQTGQGLLPRLLNDKAYGDQALAEFALLARQLNEAVAKINNGQGTAGKLIADPSLYESVNDILIGINESKLLRWLIRNRQQAGIEKRYDEAQTAPAITPLPPAETMPRAQDPVAIPLKDTVAILPPPKTDTTTPTPRTSNDTHLARGASKLDIASSHRIRRPGSGCGLADFGNDVVCATSTSRNRRPEEWPDSIYERASTSWSARTSRSAVSASPPI